jgi:hypothetical protein
MTRAPDPTSTSARSVTNTGDIQAPSPPRPDRPSTHPSRPPPPRDAPSPPQPAAWHGSLQPGLRRRPPLPTAPGAYGWMLCGSCLPTRATRAAVASTGPTRSCAEPFPSRSGLQAGGRASWLVGGGWIGRWVGRDGLDGWMAGWLAGLDGWLDWMAGCGLDGWLGWLDWMGDCRG